MKALRLDWTTLLVDFTSAFWFVPLVWSTTIWLFAGMPFFVLFLGFAIPALLRRRSLLLAVIGGVAAVIIASFSIPADVNASAAGLTLLPTAFIIAMPREITHWSMRVEFRRGMVAWLIIAVVRSILGRPPDGPLALMALAFVSLGLIGLPLLHSRGALGAGRHSLERARPGLNLSLLVLASGAGIALVVLGISTLVGGSVPNAIVQAIITILAPLAYLIVLPVVKLVQRQYLKAHAPPNLPPPTKFTVTNSLKSLHNTETIALVLGIVALLAIATAAVVVARLRREVQPLGNQAQSARDVVYEALTGSGRRRLDLGAGARRIVRAAVWRHLRQSQKGQPPPTLTARQLAEREGWEPEALERYEHARYHLSRHFDESMAQRFLRIFRRGKK